MAHQKFSSPLALFFFFVLRPSPSPPPLAFSYYPSEAGPLFLLFLPFTFKLLQHRLLLLHSTSTHSLSIQHISASRLSHTQPELKAQLVLSPTPSLSLLPRLETTQIEQRCISIAQHRLLFLSLSLSSHSSSLSQPLLLQHYQQVDLQQLMNHCSDQLLLMSVLIDPSSDFDKGGLQTLANNNQSFKRDQQ